MKDLEKLKSELEKKYKFAEIENQMEEKFGCQFMVFDRFRVEGYRIVAKAEDMHIAAALLKEYPADQEQPLDSSARNPKGTIFGPYHVRTERGFRDTYTKLKVSWINGGNEYSVDLKIDGNEILEKFFVNDQRKMTRIECDTYKPLRRGHIVRDMDLPIKRFLCNQIAYEGGYRSATETDRIMEIINAIKKEA